MDGVRLCRRPLGIVKAVPESSELSAAGSCVEVLADVEEALDATEALCAARKRDSSLVKRFTLEAMLAIFQIDRDFGPTYDSFLLLLELHM